MDPLKPEHQCSQPTDESKDTQCDRFRTYRTLALSDDHGGHPKVLRYPSRSRPDICMLDSCHLSVAMPKLQSDPHVVRRGANGAVSESRSNQYPVAPIDIVLDNLVSKHAYPSYPNELVSQRSVGSRVEILVILLGQRVEVEGHRLI